jgi:hypothetical protein
MLFVGWLDVNRIPNPSPVHNTIDLDVFAIVFCRADAQALSVIDAAARAVAVVRAVSGKNDPAEWLQI